VTTINGGGRNEYELEGTVNIQNPWYYRLINYNNPVNPVAEIVDNRYNEQTNGLNNIRRLVIDNPAAFIPKRVSGEHMPGNGYYGVFDYSSYYFQAPSYLFSLQIQSRYTPASAYSGADFSYPNRYFLPIIYIRGLKYNGTIKIQKRRANDNQGEWTDWKTFTLNTNNGPDYILRADEPYETVIGDRPLTNFRVSCDFPGASSGWAKYALVFDEIAYFYNQLIYCKDVSEAGWTPNLQTGYEKHNSVWSKYQEWFLTSANEFDRYILNQFTLMANANSYCQTLNPHPINGRCNHASHQWGGTTTSEIVPFADERYFFNEHPTKNMAISGNNIICTETVPQMKGTQGWVVPYEIYVEQAYTDVDDNVVPTEARYYIPIYGGNYDKLVAYAYMNGYFVYYDQNYNPVEVENTNPMSLTIKIGHWSDGVFTTNGSGHSYVEDGETYYDDTDPIGHNNAGFVIDVSHNVVYSHSHDTTGGNNLQGTRTAYDIDSIFSTKDQFHRGYYLIFELKNDDVNAPRSANIFTILDQKALEAYPWTTTGTYHSDGQYYPNEIKVGKMKNIKINDLKVPEDKRHTIYGLGSFTQNASAAPKNSDPHNFGTYKIYPNSSDHAIMITASMGSDRFSFRGFASNPLGVNNFYNLPANGSGNCIDIVLPNQPVYAMWYPTTSATSGDSATLTISELTNYNVSTLAPCGCKKIYKTDCVYDSSVGVGYPEFYFVDITTSITGIYELEVYCGKRLTPVDVYVTEDPIRYPLVLDDPNRKIFEEYSKTGNVNVYWTGDCKEMLDYYRLNDIGQSRRVCICQGATGADFTNGSWYYPAYDQWHGDTYTNTKMVEIQFAKDVEIRNWVYVASTPGGGFIERRMLTRDGIVGAIGTAQLTIPLGNYTTTKTLRLLVRRMMRDVHPGGEDYWGSSGELMKIKCLVNGGAAECVDPPSSSSSSSSSSQQQPTYAVFRRDYYAQFGDCTVPPGMDYGCYTACMDGGGDHETCAAMCQTPETVYNCITEEQCNYVWGTWESQASCNTCNGQVMSECYRVTSPSDTPAECDGISKEFFDHYCYGSLEDCRNGVYPLCY
jgi:hypothetical protein